jgi:anhydro-N-acetylmuramic acid kinase
MENNTYQVLGVMSGTSLDGIDLAFVTFTSDQKWEFTIHSAETIPYSRDWKQRLSQGIYLDPEELQVLDEDYTAYLAEVISAFINKHNLEDLDAVCSHGHTIKHEPENGLTLQIGNLPELAELTGQTVVCDFRVQDVALGGQGAPLVPVGDELLFSEFKYCLNLGGFANISTLRDGNRIAYDICAVNTVLNHYAEKMGMEYDKDGNIARQGSLNPELLEKLEALPFYKSPPPKSLGIEYVNKEILPLINKLETDIPSVLRTYTQHVALQISNEIGNDPSAEVLVTGGGCLNTFLLQQIKKMTLTKIVIPSLEIINYKEALIFAFLGVLKLRDEINVYSSVTGAESDHSSGEIYLP